ncbi:MAG: hypothetical protein KDI42_02965, partial [Gammaproteobacteria bacterium]|nr:hypothetical protein [Gammaproteobacteria bacterium]
QTTHLPTINQGAKFGLPNMARYITIKARLEKAHRSTAEIGTIKADHSPLRMISLVNFTANP